MEKKKQVIIVASDAGNIGKTLIASIILETLRLDRKVDAYVCDRNYQALYQRYGQKRKGMLIPLAEQNPTDGVAFLDISNPEEKIKFGESLNTESDYIVFDLPANSTQAMITSVGFQSDFLDFLDFCNAEPIFVCPIKDEKSIVSYEALKETFPNQRFVLVINGGFILASEGKTSGVELIERLKLKFQNEDHFVIDQILSPTVFDLLKEHTLREVFVPRSERPNADGSLPKSDSGYKIKNLIDIHTLNRFITDTKAEIQRLFP